MRKYLLVVIILIFTFSMTWTSVAIAEEQSLAEKLLIILKADHDITQQQYDELLKEAQKEKTAQKAAVAKQVKAETAHAAQKYKKTHPLAVNVSWKHHELYFQSNDKNFTMHIGGAAQVDFGGADLNERMRAAFPSGFEGYGAEVRRVQPTISGTLFGDFDYKMQLNFGGGKTTVQDLYMSYYGLPCFANIRVGHIKEPFSLEELTGNDWLTFTERSLSNAFVTANKFAGRNTGVMLFNTEFHHRMTWAVGGFMQQKNSSGTCFQNGYNNANVAARVTFLPWYADHGCHLLHLGFGYRHLFRSDDTNNWSSTDPAIQFESDPEWHLNGTKTVNTAALVAQGADEIDPEAAVVYGPFSVQGEYFEAFLHNYTKNDVTFTNPDFYGYYVEASWFITGEHRPYNRRYGVFGRPIPKHNFDLRAGTWGAWQVALRYSTIDLNDQNINGGTEQNWTAGLNWYLNPNLRWTFDYIHAHVDSELVGSTFLQNGDANIFDTRFQVVF